MSRFLLYFLDLYVFLFYCMVHITTYGHRDRRTLRLYPRNEDESVNSIRTHCIPLGYRFIFIFVLCISSNSYFISVVLFWGVIVFRTLRDFQHIVIYNDVYISLFKFPFIMVVLLYFIKFYNLLVKRWFLCDWYRLTNYLPKLWSIKYRFIKYLTFYLLFCCMSEFFFYISFPLLLRISRIQL